MKATHTPPTYDTDTGTTPAELLRGSARYLHTHGWTQHQFFDLLADTDELFPPACASGAIIAAATGTCPVSGLLDTDTADDHDTDTAIRAMRVFADWLDGGYVPVESCPVSSIDVIGDWNDDDERTLTEVTDALCAAADDWDRAHTTGGAR
jgi:hypothetical protein